MDFTERYFVNEDKKTVVCKLEDCCNALIHDMCHKGWPMDPSMLIDDVFIGKAKFSPEDTFDIRKGEMIAYKRAMKKLIKAKKAALSNFITQEKKMHEMFIKDTDKLINEYETAIKRKDFDIESII